MESDSLKPPPDSADLSTRFDNNSVDGAFHAIENTCTHRGGPLGEGDLNGEIVTCLWHGANFNVKTGAVTSSPAGTGVRSFVVKVEGNDVLVELA